MSEKIYYKQILKGPLILTICCIKRRALEIKILEKKTSRLALKMALALGKISVKKPEIIGNYVIKQAPDCLVSLSHTSKGSYIIGSCLTGNRKKYLSVGIDMEYVNRKLPYKSEKYFTHEKDRHMNSSLFHWVCKEAAFKALSPLDKDLKTLKQICVRDNFFSYKDFKGHVQGGKIKIKDSKLYLSYAFIH